METGHILIYMSTETHLVFMRTVCARSHTHIHTHAQCTYLCNSLQAHIVAFALALSQFLQGNSHLSNEFISSESVHVTYTQPSYTDTHTDAETEKREKQVSQWKFTEEPCCRVASLSWSECRLPKISKVYLNNQSAPPSATQDDFSVASYQHASWMMRSCEEGFQRSDSFLSRLLLHQTYWS